MSYDKNLGRVRGDDGKTYTPHVINRNGKQYVQYKDGDVVVSEYEIKSQIYVPRINPENDHLEFTLSSSPLQSIDLGSIRGPQGVATIGFETVNELPNPNNLTDAQKKLLYIIDDGSEEAYLDVAVYSEDKQDFVYLESVVRFNNYALKNRVYDIDNTYSKVQIDGLLGNIQDKIARINNVMGDTGAIIIPDDE